VVAGQLWPSGCGRAESNAAPVAAAGVRAPAATPLATGGRAAAVQSTSSTLGEQNDMFAEAVAAKRRGDTRGALAGFDRFLSLYPSSPLAESAAVERLRVLRAVDPMRTVSVAKQYLALYPNGFAHGEAEAIVAGAP
jgi:outer membrane protein assembly factor BamD (BamD/ComL family)